jgi:ribonuclease HI
MWKLAIPNAAKKIFWRACHNLLPTKDNLLRRKVVNEPLCPICEKEPETVIHALWDCPAAMDVWGNSKRTFQKCAIAGGNFIQMAEYVLSRSGVEDFGFFVQLARQMWFRRNKWVNEGIFINPNDIIRQTEELAEEFKKVNMPESTNGAVENIDRKKKWEAPPHGWYKVNWDVAIDKLQQRVGVGVVIREENGQVVAAMSKTRQGTLEPTSGEAFAAYQATCLCKDLGLQHINLEGDAKQVVEAVNSLTSSWSKYGHLIDDIRRMLQSFTRWKCNFVHREANEAAHRLAKAATMDVNDKIWRNITPNCISDIVLMERFSSIL